MSGQCFAVGMFDGVHAGHREMLAMAAAAAREHDPPLPLSVLTFHPHPRAVLAGSAPGMLTSLTRRIQLLEQLGVDHVEVQPFTPEFAAMTPQRFVSDYLVGHLQARSIVVGDNFRFGHRAAGDVSFLQQHGAELGLDVRVCDLAVDDGAVVSSSRIRDLLVTHEVQSAARLLGRDYELDGIVVRGAQRGRELGFRTANLRIAPDRLIPADGVYGGCASFRFEGHAVQRIAAISIGTNPQFDPGGTAPRSVEVHLLDFDEDDVLYDEELQVTFSRFVRGQATFRDVPALVEQIRADVATVRSTVPTCGA